MDYVPSYDEYMFDEYALEADTGEKTGRLSKIKTAVVNWFQSKIKWIQTKVQQARGEHKTLFGALLAKVKSLFTKVKSSNDPDEIIEIQQMTQAEINKTKGQIAKRNGYDSPEAMLKDKREKAGLRKQQKMREEGAKKGVTPEMQAKRDAYVAKKNAAKEEAERQEREKAERRAKRNAAGIAKQASRNEAKSKIGVNPRLAARLKMPTEQARLKAYRKRKKDAEAAEKRKKTREMNKLREETAKQQSTAIMRDIARGNAPGMYTSRGAYESYQDLYDDYDYDDDFAIEAMLYDEDDDFDETDLALEAVLDEYYADPEVTEALENMQLNVDINCTDDDACEAYYESLDAEVEKYNRNLRVLRVATESYQFDGDSDAFKTTTASALEQLQATHAALGFTLNDGVFNEACIEQLNQFFIGADEIMYNKALEFVDDADLYDDEFDDGDYDDTAAESFLELLTL